MTGLSSVLKGVQPDLRDTIRRLHQEGWTPSKTNGGHIRLEHADAAKPVFTSSTPSDFRTPFNLVRDCRSALMGTARCPDPSTTLIGPDQAAEILSMHKRKRRRSGRRSVETIPALVVSRIGSEPARKEDRRRNPAVEQGPIVARDVTGEEQMTRIETPEAGQQEQQKELTEMNMIVEPEIATATRVPEVPAAAPTARATPAPRVKAPSVGGTTRTARAGSPKADPVSAPVPVTGSVPLDQEAVRIGMMIARGELTTLTITPEMVGQTLVFTRPPYLIAALAETAEGVPAAPRIIRRNLAFNDAILDFLRGFAGEDVPLSMIAEHMVSKGHYRQRSARFGVRSRLDQLVEAGLVTLICGPGEPHARLIG
ncbi:hypothetical protein IQ03_01354 [Gemmobacter caeni]|uniref:Uncharacterized protein n=2 Tax=Gemmobacter caeni TaxID=589035 RepID=A0A2T6B8L4_9RHOB|nr:hypothetical protein C8N34_102172 [Gemmobacter caeni]TWJ02935.1 hypothetical protein IQ03_01354 [Gemmobacter caeni]